MSAEADSKDRQDPRLIVGIGASAGGLDACKRLLGSMPQDSDMALVIVMHLDPNRESHIAEILKSSSTALEVVQAKGEQPLEPNCAYVIAPDTSLEIRGGVLYTQPPRDPHGARKPVDALLSSLAADRGVRAVGVILSGTGNNGSAGIQDIKARGGLCIVQEPETAQYDGMPQSAIATGCADYVLPPEEMPRILIGYADSPDEFSSGGAQAHGQQEEPPGPFDRILDLLGRTYGVNFRGAYKRGTLERRADRRLGLKQRSGWKAYLELLQEDPGEVAALYRDLLIGVTGFFRDPVVWEEIETQVLPELLSARDDEMPFKIWVPGCATGEEPYSLAMLVLEQLQGLGRQTKVQIFATDVAEDALTFARRGLYPASIADAVTPARISRFFRQKEQQLEISRDVRDAVTFAVHNLLADPPFSHIDLVSCRNVLIYLESHAQQRALELFQFALKPGGLLLLGASETVGTHGDIFETVSPKARIYRSTATSQAARHHHLRWAAERAPLPPPPGVRPAPLRGPKVSRIIEQMVLSRYTWACVAVSESFEIQSFFGRTQDYLLQPTGEARMDLLAWAKAGIYPRLRIALERARERKELVKVSDMRVEREGTTERVECTIEPVTPLPGEARMFLVAFRDVPHHPPAAEVPETTASDEPLVRQLEAELKNAREELQSTAEQLESTNEEYRASHEELLSLNEELQSNNEELQASKEELQSLNEEMVTINRQLEDKNVELRETNGDLNNLLVNAKLPILFLDRDMRVRRFTPATTEVLRVQPTDLGRSLEHIKARFQGEGLLDDARKVLDKLVPIEEEVHTEEGRWYQRTVLPYRTEDERIDGVCITFQDVTDRKRAEEQQARLAAIVTTSDDAIITEDLQGIVQTWNEGAKALFGYTAEEAIGKPIPLLMPPDRVDEGPGILERIRRGETVAHYETVRRRKDGSLLDISLTVSPIQDAAGRVIGASQIARDTTQRKAAEDKVRESEERLRFTLEATDVGHWDLDLATDTSIRTLRHDQIFGYDALLPEWGYQTFLHKHVHADDRTRVVQAFEQALAEGTSWTFECRIIRVDQVERWIWVNGNVYGRHEGQSRRMAGLVMDITERKQMEYQLQKYATDLAETDHRKNEFLAMLGHELRNPLAAVMHGIDLLGLGRGDHGRIEEIQAMMRRQARRIAGLLDQLLEIARLDAGKIQLAQVPVDLAQAVQAAVEAVASLFETHKHEVSVSIPRDEPALVRGDLMRLTQVVENLLSNAAKYTEDGGKVELSLESRGDRACIRVRDTGIGMDAELLPHIFELFTQAPRTLDRSAGGLGLGLPLVRRVVELHGGTVEAMSAGRGQGSEFVVTLPRLREQGAKERPEDGDAEPAAAEARRTRILVVDDEEDSATALAAILTIQGHESRAVFDGPAALEAVRTFHPDVVLLDLGLPAMNGYEVAKRLREEHQDGGMLLVALTGYQKDEERFSEAGFDRHLIKPPDTDKLARWLAEWDSDGEKR